MPDIPLLPLCKNTPFLSLREDVTCSLVLRYDTPTTLCRVLTNVALRPVQERLADSFSPFFQHRLQVALAHHQTLPKATTERLTRLHSFLPLLVSL